MTNDSAFISEIWAFISPYIGSDDRPEVCDGLIEICDSYNRADGLEADVGFEKQLGAAIREYFGVDLDDDDAEREHYVD